MELKDNDNIEHKEEEYKEAKEPEREEETAEPVEEGIEAADDFDEEEEEEIEESDEMEKLYEQSFVEVEEGTILRGRIVGLSGAYALVDVGYKSEGIVPLDEFSDPDSINIGDEIDVYLVSAEDQDGMVVLSKRRADRIRNWQKVLSAYEKGEPIEGRIKSRIKGGFLVDIGLEAFLPMSHLSTKPEDNPDEFVRQTFQFKIIKLNRRRRNVVVSRKLLIEEERQKQREKTLSEIQVGQLREGVVKNITDFGAFIDLGGVDGLLHITDMSWGRISHPSQILSVGDKIEVMVLDFDPERMRISLGLKQKTPDPWLAVDEKYPVGAKVKGRVVSIADYGAFVELEPGVEGLVHISEMSWTKRVRHPSEIVNVGDEVEVVVLAVDKNARKMSLG